MNKRITILGAAAVVAIGLVVLLASQRAPEPEGSLLAGPVLPGLAERINDVDSIRIVQAGEQPVLTLSRAGDGWTVVERDGYPANAGKVRTALLNLAQSKVVETKTSNPERYAQLGVEDTDGEAATGVRIELTGEGIEPAALIVGNYAGQQGEGTYVRRPGEAQSLMAAGNLVPERQVGDWLRRELTDIASSRIRQIELVEGDGRPLRVFKDTPEEANFQVADVPRGRALQSEVVANGLASTLSGLTLDDVARAGDEVPEGVTRHRATYTLFNGVVLALDGYQSPADADGNAGLAWVQIEAALDRDRALAQIAERIEAEQSAALAATETAGSGSGDTEATAEAAGADVDAAERPAAADVEGAAPAANGATDGAVEAGATPAAIDVEARTAELLAEAQAEVDELNSRLGGWRFRVPAFKYTNIDKSIDDLLQPIDG